MTHVTATWLCAETWHRAPTSQLVPRKGDGPVCGPAGVDLLLVPECLWKCMTEWLFQVVIGLEAQEQVWRQTHVVPYRPMMVRVLLMWNRDVMYACAEGHK